MCKGRGARGLVAGVVRGRTGSQEYVSEGGQGLGLRGARRERVSRCRVLGRVLQRCGMWTG